MSPHLTLAIDIGGTFTDTVLVDHENGLLASNKVLTTHQNPAQGALSGALRATNDAGRALSDVTRFIHGTTLATNALIEKRGAVTATITTDGFRDILEIGYERRYAQYDINIQKPQHLVARDRSFTIRERVEVHGQVLRALKQSEIDTCLRLLEQSDIEALAICLLHSYANPTHETILAEAIAKARPDLAISRSSAVSPEAREYDRLSTTVANAYIQPLMSRYLAQLQTEFQQHGLTCPILMMTASGGMCTLDVAARYPIRLVESGPAGGAILAAEVARAADLDAVLSFDMGGTTAKLCLIDHGQPQTSRSFEIARAARFTKGSGLPVRIPVIDMIEIGAGGGSIAGVDRLGRLTVGPESAGSEPGPVGFGRGGMRPTVTDADLAQGFIQPESFAQGDFTPDPQAAQAAITANIAHDLDIPGHEAAQGISLIVDETMAAAARMHAVEKGAHLGQRVMVAFGGNGPLHATRLARAAGVNRVLIPQNPGVGSAIGFIYAPVSFERVRSQYTLLSAFDPLRITVLLAQMEAEARSVVQLGAPDTQAQMRRVAFARYAGQGHEIEITLPDGAPTSDWPEILSEAFSTAYADQFSRPVPGMEIEILNWAVRVWADVAPMTKRAHAATDAKPERAETILCDVTGCETSARVIDRPALAPNQIVQGPALITEPQTTTLVSADFSAKADLSGNLWLTRLTSEDRL